MTTITSPFLPLSGITAIPHQSWLAAWVEAVVGAVAALLAGSAGVDPAVGYRCRQRRYHLGPVTKAVLLRLEKDPRDIVAS